MPPLFFMVYPGLYTFLEDKKNFYRRRIGILTHQAACDLNFDYTLSVLLKEGLNIRYVFAPEHGFFSEEQDQMPVKNTTLYDIPVISLYGKALVPSESVLSEIDTVVIDLVDVGTRYYTYIWTAVLLLKKLHGLDKEIIILDRPNPLGNLALQGPVLKEEYFSFVGLLPIPVVHGMTLAELLLFAKDYYNVDVNLKVYKITGYRREMRYEETGLPFIPPSPNMPHLSTARVYPGMCLLEATNLSEGRGTTRPFEIFGAPFINPFLLIKEMGKIEGAIIRPYYFIPTFNKYRGEIAAGGFIHIEDPLKFNSFEFSVKLIKTVKKLYPHYFEFKAPPYEYEEGKMPFDILTGSDFIRKHIDSMELEEMRDIWKKEYKDFLTFKEKYSVYD